MFFWDQHKTITSCYELFTRKVCDRYQLTQMEYDILMFLHNNPKYNTAADIVKIRKSTKSHVSTSLKALENKGLIERIQSTRNKKHIEIVILNKAESIIEDGMKAQKEFAKNALDGLTEEEKYMCMAVFNKICANADAYLKKYAAGGRGDKKLVYRTALMKQLPPYPVFPGEKYVGLGYKYMLADRVAPLLTMNKVLCLVEYREDGSSRNMFRQYVLNPRGFAFLRKEGMKYQPSRRRRFMEAVHYVSASLLARNPGFLRESPRPLLTLAALPFGVVLTGLILAKNGRKE